MTLSIVYGFQTLPKNTLPEAQGHQLEKLLIYHNMCLSGFAKIRQIGLVLEISR